MHAEEIDPGRSAWEVRLTFETPGPHALGVRIVPSGNAEGDLAEPGLALVRWL